MGVKLKVLFSFFRLEFIEKNNVDLLKRLAMYTTICQEHGYLNGRHNLFVLIKNILKMSINLCIILNNTLINIFSMSPTFLKFGQLLKQLTHKIPRKKWYKSLSIFSFFLLTLEAYCLLIRLVQLLDQKAHKSNKNNGWFFIF